MGVVGFGTFGRFLAARLIKAGHSVSATSRTDYSREAAEIGVEFFADADDFCERHPDVVVLATSILSAGELFFLPLSGVFRGVEVEVHVFRRPKKLKN